MNTAYVPRPPAVAEIKKSAWKGAPSINSPNAETAVEVCGLVNFARTVDRDMCHVSGCDQGVSDSVSISVSDLL
jgi:hypothetical protein